MTHTPGPWFAHRFYVLDEYGNKVSVTCDEKHIAQGDPTANAILIAAAPELLAALVALLAIAEKQFDQSATHDGLTNCDLIIQARNAIQKASA